MNVATVSARALPSPEPATGLIDHRPGPRDERLEDFARLLVEVHAPGLRRYVARLLPGDPHRTEDVVQEVLLRAWQNRDQLAGQKSTRPWLFRVARNLSVDWYRRQTSRPVEVPDENTLDLADDLALDRLENVLSRCLLTDALRPLSHQHREVLVQLYYFGRSQAEVALVLGIAQGTVKSRAHYALAEIRRPSAPP